MNGTGVADESHDKEQRHDTEESGVLGASTGFAALALGATGAADLLRVPANRERLTRLGYSAMMTHTLPYLVAKESWS